MKGFAAKYVRIVFVVISFVFLTTENVFSGFEISGKDKDVEKTSEGCSYSGPGDTTDPDGKRAPRTVTIKLPNGKKIVLFRK